MRIRELHSENRYLKYCLQAGGVAKTTLSALKAQVEQAINAVIRDNGCCASITSSRGLSVIPLPLAILGWHVLRPESPLYTNSQGTSPCGSNFEVINAYGLTRLMLAAVEGDVDNVKKLVTEGTSAQIQARVQARDQFDSTALMFAAFQGTVESVHVLLVAGSEIEACHIEGGRALIIAAIKGHSEVVKVLTAGTC